MPSTRPMKGICMPHLSASPVQDLRARLLRTAYLNQFQPVKSMALFTDMALDALATRDPAAAEQLVTDMASQRCAPDQLIVERAQAAAVPGLETWAERAKLLEDFARFPYDIDRRDADSEAQRLWAGLREYLPQVAASLALYLRQLPQDWMLDLFAADSVGEIRHSGAKGVDYRPPEVAPYEDSDDCPACGDVQDMCRVHIGHERGVAYARALLATAAADATALRDLTEPQQQPAAKGTPGEPADPVEPVEALLALLGSDALAWERLEERHHELESRRVRADHYRAQGHEALAQQILEGTTWA